MNQDDWIKNFRANNGRDPRADEYATALAAGEFTVVRKSRSTSESNEKTSGQNIAQVALEPKVQSPSPIKAFYARYRKWIWATVFSVVGIAIILTIFNPLPKASKPQKATTTTQTQTTIQTTQATTEAAQTTEVITKSENKLWSEEKANSLKGYILNTWGPALGQSYTAYRPSSSGSFYGVTIPNDLLEKTSTTTQGMIPDVNGTVPYWVWNENGEADPGQTAVVAVYSDIAPETYAKAHLYVFAIANGVPQVLVTEQNQGNPERRLYFRETQNADLKAYFTKLVTGREAEVETPSATVDTKNLTIEQSANWAKAYTASQSNQGFTKDDYISDVTTIAESSDGLVYIEVRENHDSPKMRATGADPNTAPLVGRYRINAKGELEKHDIVDDTYTVVSINYFE